MQEKIELNLFENRLFADLVEYVKLDDDLVKKRIGYAMYEIACQYLQMPDSNLFLLDTDLTLYEDTKNTILKQLYGINEIQNMIKQIQQLGGGRILDYGGNVGEFSLACDENGVHVTYYEFPNQSRQYALWRFEKYVCKRIFIATPFTEDFLFAQRWNFVNMNNTIETFMNVKDIIEKLSRSAQYVFCNPDKVQIDIYHPQNLNFYKEELEKYFTNIKDNLWKNKNKVM